MVYAIFSGGLSNFLYYVSLPSKHELVVGSTASKRPRRDSYQTILEPTKVLLRIYGQTHGEHALETMLTESVVFTLLSERRLGPKLHGIFPGGRIEQYIPVRVSDCKNFAKTSKMRHFNKFYFNTRTQSELRNLLHF